MKSLILDLEENLTDDQIDAIIKKLEARKKVEKQEPIKTAIDGLTKEQITIIKNVEKIIENDLIKYALHYDYDNVNGYIKGHIQGGVDDYFQEIEDEINYFKDIVNDTKRIIKEKSEELKDDIKDLECFKKRKIEATKAKDLLKKLKKTLKTK